MASIKLIIASLIAGAVLTAQPSRVAGPVLGLVVDANFRLRPVLGVPGSAYLDQPLSLDPSIQIAAISPHQDYVLAIRGDARDLVLIRDPMGSGVNSVVDGAAGAGRVILSRTGSAALLLSADAQHFQVISGLPDLASVAWQSGVSAISGEPSSIAVSDDGKAVLVAAAAGDHTSIFLVTAEAGPRVVASAGQLRGLAFLAGRTDALIGDAAANQARVIWDPAGAASELVVGDVSRLVDIASSEDGRTVYLATTNPSGVLSVDLSTGAKHSNPCDCTPTALVPLSRAGLFRLTDLVGGELWIFDGGAMNPRIVIVPGDSFVSAGIQ